VARPIEHLQGRFLDAFGERLDLPWSNQLIPRATDDQGRDGDLVQQIADIMGTQTTGRLRTYGFRTTLELRDRRVDHVKTRPSTERTQPSPDPQSVIRRLQRAGNRDSADAEANSMTWRSKRGGSGDEHKGADPLAKAHRMVNGIGQGGHGAHRVTHQRVCVEVERFEDLGKVLTQPCRAIASSSFGRSTVSSLVDCNELESCVEK